MTATNRRSYTSTQKRIILFLFLFFVFLGHIITFSTLANCSRIQNNMTQNSPPLQSLPELPKISPTPMMCVFFHAQTRAGNLHSITRAQTQNPPAFFPFLIAIALHSSSTSHSLSLFVYTANNPSSTTTIPRKPKELRSHQIWLFSDKLRKWVFRQLAIRCH